ERVVEGVRRRLLALVQKAPPTEFEGYKAPNVDEIMAMQRGVPMPAASRIVTPSTMQPVGRFGGGGVANNLVATPVHVQNAVPLTGYSLPPVSQNPYLQGAGGTAGLQATVVKPVLATDAFAQGRGLGGGGAVV
ncbi:hypothetical protein HK097_006067, partial [Rhizophlyctis rosea]